MKTYKVVSYGQSYRRPTSVDIVEVLDSTTDSNGRIPIRIWRQAGLYFDMPHKKVIVDMAYGNMPYQSLQALYQPIPKDWNMDEVYDNYARRA